MADGGVSEVAVEARGSMAVEEGLSHGVATEVVIVEAFVVHPEALHPTRWPSDLFNEEEIKIMAHLRWHEDLLGVMEPPARTALPTRSDHDSCVHLWRMGLKGWKGRVSPLHYST